MLTIDEDHTVGSVLFSQENIRLRIEDMAKEIDEAFKGVDQVLAIGVLKGAAFFTADLARMLKTPTLVSYTTISSYGWNALQSDGPRLQHDSDIPVQGRHVLIVEDIIDSGRTMSMLKQRLLANGALSVRIAILLDLLHRAEDRAVTPDFVGFKSRATWVCGYGIDYKEHYRNLPDIRQIENPSA